MTEQVVTGLGDVQQFLDQLPAKIQKNILRGAMRAAAKVPLAVARETVPVGPPSGEGARLYGGHRGALKESLRISTRSRGTVVSAKVIAGGKTKSGADTFYAHMVEGGTKPHDIKPRRHKSLFFAGLMRDIVKHPGAKAQPFLGPALSQHLRATLDAAAAYIRARLTKAGIETPDSGGA